MRLINCSTLQLEDFIGRDVPAYAILSHTWGRAEVSFAELNSGAASTKSKDGYKKITFTCKQAIEDNLQYAWVDTCCIDKSSSAELSEAINSMFQWYRRSTVCYAYLSDVTLEEFRTEFARSRWFTRSWTLQELLAPDHVTFFDQSWKRLGTRIEHAAWIAQLTRIDEDALSGYGEGYGDDYSLNSVCAARRMSWASHREATRVEDAAYALLGIFDVNMPLLYGEGSMAFTRLQEEIFKRSGDESIFAWGLDSLEVGEENAIGVPIEVAENCDGHHTLYITSMMATSPKEFGNCYDLDYGIITASPFMLISGGLQLDLPLVSIHPEVDEMWPRPWLALLNCRPKGRPMFLGILLYEALAAPKMMFERRTVRGSQATFLINTTVALRAVQHKVTVLDQAYISDRIESQYETYHYMVNDSPVLQNMGYYISGARFWSSTVSLKLHSDLNLKTFTTHFRYLYKGLLIISFKSENGSPEFSILIKGENAVVRDGSKFSVAQLSQLLDTLQGENTEAMVLTCNAGRRVRIVVILHERRVCHLQICEVKVDCVPIDIMDLTEVVSN